MVFYQVCFNPLKSGRGDSIWVSEIDEETLLKYNGFNPLKSGRVVSITQKQKIIVLLNIEFQSPKVGSCGFYEYNLK